MLARRFSCPPITECLYEPRDVPNATRDMEGTVILRPGRDEWIKLLGEMVQITNEAVRRRATCMRDASKPLSLEYMADRLDVDDPIFGYLAVARATGWMQGYVLATKFTTWSRGFRWDSTNPILDLHAGPHDDEGSQHAAAAATSPEGFRSSAPTETPAAASRVIDADGTLSAALMSSVHAGDPDGEGVVWPRVCEISLLGALGCGRWLVQLVLDGLEQPDSPYEYAVIQATDGSIPFYEKMGFVRVGAVQEVARPADAPAVGEKAAAASGHKRQKVGGASADTDACESDLHGPPASGPVISRSVAHICAEGDTCVALAKRFKVPADDILLINAPRFPGLSACARLKAGTKLRVPQPLKPAEQLAAQTARHQSFYILPEDASLRKVAETLNLSPKALLELNRYTLKGTSLHTALGATWHALLTLPPLVPRGMPSSPYHPWRHVACPPHPTTWHALLTLLPLAPRGRPPTQLEPHQRDACTGIASPLPSSPPSSSPPPPPPLSSSPPPPPPLSSTHPPLQTAGLHMDVHEYCHWTFPEDDLASAQVQSPQHLPLC